MTPRRAIGGKTLNSGIRGGLWEVKHYEKMRDAVWLFGWLVHRQTTQRNGTGLVLRGKALSYADIRADTGWPERTLRRWMARLQKEGYIEVKHSAYSRMVIRILNAKKFNPKQLEFSAALFPSSRPNVADLSRPDVADIQAKSGRLKEGAEFEQKHLGRGADAPTASPQGTSKTRLPVADGFEKFYAAYPRKRGKADAEKAWRKVKPEEVEAILARLEIFKLGEWRGKDQQYIPHPATWLNGRRWEDEIEAGNGDAKWHPTTVSDAEAKRVGAYR